MKKVSSLIATTWGTAWPGLTLLAVLVLLRLLGLFEGMELRLLDAFLRLRPAEPTDPRIVIVGIDETDIQQLGTYPVPDGVLAQLLQRLDQYGPRVVGIDIYRDLPVAPGHERWTQTLAALPEVIAIEKVVGDPVRPPAALPPERVGFVDLPLDDDGFVRRVLLGTHDAAGAYHFGLSLRLAETYLASAGLSLENGLQDPQAMRFGTVEFPRFQPNSGGYVGADAGGPQILLLPRSGPNPFRTVPLRAVMAGTVDPAWFQDAIVLVGVTSLSAKDLVNSGAIAGANPGLVYGVELQAHATSQLVSAVLDGRSPLRVWPDPVESGWIVLWGLLGGGLVLVARSLPMALAGGAGLLLVLLGTGFVLIGLHWWIPVGVPALALAMTGAITTSLRLFQTQQQQQMTMRLLGQQTSPEIANALWDARQWLTQGGRLPPQRLTATILFSDIRSFTTLSEQQSPEQVMGWLNDYFVAMTEEVQRHHGVVNKFIGDGLMAVFGVPIPHTAAATIAGDAQNAVACSLAMGQRLEGLNRNWQRQGLTPIQVRIGIFTGPVMVGSLGGDQRLEYGIIGDSVNTAARLESCQKDRQPSDCRILVARETLAHLDQQFTVEAWGEVALRGKQHPVQIYRVLGQAAIAEAAEEPSPGDG